jgi:hypothetical protein
MLNCVMRRVKLITQLDDMAPHLEPKWEPREVEPTSTAEEENDVASPAEQVVQSEEAHGESTSPLATQQPASNNSNISGDSDEAKENAEGVEGGEEKGQVSSFHDVPSDTGHESDLAINQVDEVESDDRTLAKQNSSDHKTETSV